MKSSVQRLLDELKESNHVLVEFTNPELQSTSFKNTLNLDELQEDGQSQIKTLNETNHIKLPSYLIFAPFEFAKDKVQIVRLLFIISEKDDFNTTGNTAFSSVHTNGACKKNDRIGKKTEDGAKKEEGSYSTVRRLSSSNSFLDMNVMMNKLSKIAQINPNMNKTNNLKNDQSNIDQGGAFIITPNSKTNGYLLYVKLPKISEGNIFSNFIKIDCFLKLLFNIPYRKIFVDRSHNKFICVNACEKKSVST